MSDTATLSADTAPLTTARLLLRPICADDAAPLFALFNNWQVVRMLAMPPWPYTRQDADDFIASPPRGEQMRAIALAGDFVGCIGVRETKAGPLQSGDGPHIGYWLGEPFWGRGYMTEALNAVSADLFARRPELTTIYSGVIADNVASLRVQEKVGFVHDIDGVLDCRPRGETVPHISTKLTRAAFERL